MKQKCGKNGHGCLTHDTCAAMTHHWDAVWTSLGGHSGDTNKDFLSGSTKSRCIGHISVHMNLIL